MPYKHNEKRRHKIQKSRYKVTNWKEYNQSLRNRGNITVWFTEEAIQEWTPEKTGKRGRPFENFAYLNRPGPIFRRNMFKSLPSALPQHRFKISRGKSIGMLWSAYSAGNDNRDLCIS